MSKKEFIIALPNCDIQRVKAWLMDSQAKNWLYFGKDGAILSRLENDLGQDYNFIDTVPLLKSVPDEIKFEYTAWIDGLNRKYGKDLEWWLGVISSRNIYSSDLFQYACYLRILDRLFSEKEGFPDLIFVESKGFAKDLKGWAVRKKINVSIEERLFTEGKAALYIKPLLDWIRFIVICLSRWWAALLSAPLSKKRDAFPPSAIVIHTAIYDNSLSKDGVLNERYLPFLYDYAARNGLKTIIHPMLYGFKCSYVSIFKRIRKSNIPIIIREDFLCLSDYFAALSYPFRRWRKKIEIENFHSFDLSHSLREMRSKECFSPAMDALLIYRLFFRLKNKGFDPSNFILWFENQVADKALIAGVRKNFPHAKITGAQMFLHPPNFLSLYPVQSEVESGVAPDIMIETSQFQCGRAGVFTGSVPRKAGAALRYAHIFEQGRIDRQPAKGKKNIIFVALPFDLTIATEMLFMLKEALPGIRHDLVIFVKSHPDYDLGIIKKSFGNSGWPEAFKVFKGSIADELKNITIMISANSSALIEAVSCGIPSIYAGSRVNINQNMLKDTDMPISRECYTPTELAQAINHYIDILPLKTEEFREAGCRIRDRYFTPVSENTLAPFFDKEPQGEDK